MDGFWNEIFEVMPNILLAWTTLFLIAIAPGPSVSAILGISMSRGRKAGFVFTAGCMTGAAIWASLAGLGLTAWLNSYANGIYALKIIGGLYLLWMAFKAVRSSVNSKKELNLDRKIIHSKNLYSRGLALHLTNPKAILGWAAVITLSQTENGSIAALVFTLVGSLFITISVHFTYAAIFGSKAAMNYYKKTSRWIEAGLASIYGFASYKLLMD